jgi:hypothetical protein
MISSLSHMHSMSWIIYIISHTHLFEFRKASSYYTVCIGACACAGGSSHIHVVYITLVSLNTYHHHSRNKNSQEGPVLARGEVLQMRLTPRTLGPGLYSKSIKISAQSQPQNALKYASMEIKTRAPRLPKKKLFRTVPYRTRAQAGRVA